MQPHTDYMRALAARFAGETNVPIAQLGIIHDQPASAEAIYAASEPLVIETEDFNDSARETLRNVALMALAAQEDVPLAELPPEMTDFVADFRNPAMPSVVSQTDAMVKIASVVPGFAGTSVFFEQIGFPEDMRRKAIAEIADATGLNIVPCDKSAPVRSDRRKFQIQWMQGWKLFVTKDSLDLIKDLRNYCFEKDKDGNLTDFPIHEWSHGPDALRYALYTQFAGKNTGNYTIGFASRQRTHDTLHR